MFNGHLKHIKSRHLCGRSSLYASTENLRQQHYHLSWGVGSSPGNKSDAHRAPVKQGELQDQYLGPWLLSSSDLNLNHSIVLKAASSKVLHVLFASSHLPVLHISLFTKFCDICFELCSAFSLSPHLLPHSRHHIFQLDCLDGTPEIYSTSFPASPWVIFLTQSVTGDDWNIKESMPCYLGNIDDSSLSWELCQSPDLDLSTLWLLHCESLYPQKAPSIWLRCFCPTPYNYAELAKFLKLIPTV